MKKLLITLLVVSGIALGAAMNTTPKVVQQSGTMQPYKLILSWGFTTTGASAWVDNPGNLRNWTLETYQPASTTFDIKLEGSIDGGSVAYTMAALSGPQVSGTVVNFADCLPSTKVRIRSLTYLGTTSTVFGSATAYGVSTTIP